MTLREQALKAAISQLGVAETKGKPNQGPEVNQYLKSVGLNPGYAWCMAFVYWCYNKAAEQMGVKNPLIRTAGVMNHWNKAKPEFKRVIPMAGDIFIMDYGKGLGHTGFVKSVSEKTIETIEGNTNDEGSREGYEVCIRQRDRSKIKGYLRY